MSENIISLTVFPTYFKFQKLRILAYGKNKTSRLCSGEASYFRARYPGAPSGFSSRSIASARTTPGCQISCLVQTSALYILFVLWRSPTYTELHSRGFPGPWLGCTWITLQSKQLALIVSVVGRRSWQKCTASSTNGSSICECGSSIGECGSSGT